MQLLERLQRHLCKAFAPAEERLSKSITATITSYPLQRRGLFRNSYFTDSPAEERYFLAIPRHYMVYMGK
jgi:hypothetical protein